MWRELRIQAGITTLVMLLALVSLSSAPAAAAILHFDGSLLKLVGASDVDVGGTLYDVEFVDDLCLALISGCGLGSTNFTFQTQTDATEAAHALVEQVFVGPFDMNPSFLFGCSDEFICQTYIPFPNSPNPALVNVIQVSNSVLPLDDDRIEADFTVLTPGSSPFHNNFARFLPTPVPSGTLLFSSGLLALVACRWFLRRHKGTQIG